MTMKPFAALALLSVSACAGRVIPSDVSTSSVPDSAAIRRDIAYLASDRLEGRLTGTPGNDSAAAYIARRYRALRLIAPVPDYLQRFPARALSDVHAGRTEPRQTENVAAIVRGRDPALREEYIVIGAHFDHLGRSSEFATDPEAKDAIRNGADDNASGTAAVMELARLFAANPPKRSLMFVNFSGEELGLLGSSWFVDHSPVPLTRIAAMLNFDMVGRLRDDKLIVYGTKTATEMAALLDSANAAPDARFKLTALGDGFGPSDQTSFYTKDIPVLHFFTDTHDDYHRATDDVEKINAAGEARIVSLAMNVARSIADRPGRLSFQKSTAPQMGSSRSGSQVYLGSVPDMAASDVTGIRLSGVRQGSPAELAGLKAGDVIVELGGATVKDLYSYSDALYSHKPGDVVKVVAMRGTQRVELSVTLGKRGG
jgi:peptidase M28-like protein/PDZ domain-containing protein